ncbi:SDR family oxidoreductase, partial [Saccharothrix algeriensis]
MTGRAGAPRVPPGEFEGKVVLVTGGAKRVGRAVVHEFAALGAHVVVNYFHSEQAAHRTREEVLAAGGSCELLRASITKPDDVGAMFDAVRERHGALDVLVNNAARGVFVPTPALTELDWQKVFDVNVHGARRCALAALPLLAEVGGAVVNVSSIGTDVVMENYTAVAASKGALEVLSRYLAVEFASSGVRVNVASAGLLDNPTAELFPGAAGVRARSAASTPLGRLGTEEELARLVVVLASPRLGWVTGRTLLADGGLSLGHALLRPDPPGARVPAARAADTPPPPPPHPNPPPPGATGRWLRAAGRTRAHDRWGL